MAEKRGPGPKPFQPPGGAPEALSREQRGTAGRGVTSEIEADALRYRLLARHLRAVAFQLDARGRFTVLGASWAAAHRVAGGDDARYFAGGGRAPAGARAGRAEGALPGGARAGQLPGGGAPGDSRRHPLGGTARGDLAGRTGRGGGPGHGYLSAPRHPADRRHPGAVPVRRGGGAAPAAGSRVRGHALPEHPQAAVPRRDGQPRLYPRRPP